MHGVPVAMGLEREEPLRLPREHLVGQALERLPEHDEVAVLRIPRTEVQVREPPLTPPVPPLRCEHDEIERVCDLHLEPCGSPTTCVVGRVGRLHHHALVPAGTRIVEEPLGRSDIVRLDPRDAQLGRKPLVEPLQSLTRRQVDKIFAVQMEDVEEERRERNLAPEPRPVRPAPEAAHRHLERPRATVRAESDRLAVEDRRPRIQCQHGLDDLGHAIRDLRKIAREHPHVVSRPVDLDARPVELPLDDRRGDAVEGGCDVGGGLRQHRLQRT